MRAFPQEHDSNSLQQDEEYVELHIGKKEQKICTHDYTVELTGDCLEEIARQSIGRTYKGSGFNTWRSFTRS